MTFPITAVISLLGLLAASTGAIEVVDTAAQQAASIALSGRKLHHAQYPSKDLIHTVQCQVVRLEQPSASHTSPHCHRRLLPLSQQQRPLAHVSEHLTRESCVPLTTDDTDYILL